MKNEKEENIEFQIKGIEILDSFLKTPKQVIPKGIAYQFDMKIEHRVDVEKKFVMVLTSASCFVDKDQEDLSRFKSSCIYYLPQLEKYINKETKALDLPEQFLISINSISISTTRGLMFSFLKGTFLHNAVIPIVNPIAFKMEGK